MHMAPIVGLGGDALTFLGGILLAIDATKRERELRRLRALKHPHLARLVIEVDGVVVKSADDLETMYVHRSSKTAVRGCCALAAGFLLLLLARGLEVATPAFSGSCANKTPLTFMSANRIISLSDIPTN